MAETLADLGRVAPNLTKKREATLTFLRELLAYPGQPPRTARRALLLVGFEGALRR